LRTLFYPQKFFSTFLKAILQAQEVAMEEIYAAITPIATTSTGSSQPTSPDVVVSPQLIAGVNVCWGRKY